MNKSDLISTVAANTALNRHQARQAVQSLLDVLAAGMMNLERISITGFGSFNVVPRAPKIARNMRTGETIIAPARNAVVFRPAKNLSQNLNRKRKEKS